MARERGRFRSEWGEEVLIVGVLSDYFCVKKMQFENILFFCSASASFSPFIYEKTFKDSGTKPAFLNKNHKGSQNKQKKCNGALG